jgi:hypothetical protein
MTPISEIPAELLAGRLALCGHLRIVTCSDVREAGRDR